MSSDNEPVRMVRRLFDAPRGMVEEVLPTLDLKPGPPLQPGCKSSWSGSSEGVAVHLGEVDVDDDQPWCFALLEGDPEALERDIGGAAYDVLGDDAFHFLIVEEALAYYAEVAIDVYLSSDGVVVMADAPVEELLNPLKVVGACATDELNEEGFRLLDRAARTPHEVLQDVAIDAIRWSSWERFAETLAAVAADEQSAPKTRDHARDVLAARQAASWSLMPPG